ncbi:MAG: SDR family oxidoreductase [Planctomycetota bacterium]
MPDPLTILITGANRGLGLELTRQFIDRGHTVLGCARDLDDASELRALTANLHPCDVTDFDSVNALALKLSGKAIDVLINNAGAAPEPGSIEEIDVLDVKHHLDVNTLGALRVSKALMTSLRAGSTKLVVHMSSELGSIGLNASGGYYAYRMGKAALNMMSKTMACEHADEGFQVLAIHPGWVQTRMGGERAPLTVEQSCSGMADVILNAASDSDRKANGAFLDHTGETLAW